MNKLEEAYWRGFHKRAEEVVPQQEKPNWFTRKFDKYITHPVMGGIDSLFSKKDVQPVKPITSSSSMIGTTAREVGKKVPGWNKALPALSHIGQTTSEKK